jgi:hypothetical protein
MSSVAELGAPLNLDLVQALARALRGGFRANWASDVVIGAIIPLAQQEADIEYFLHRQHVRYGGADLCPAQVTPQRIGNLMDSFALCRTSRDRKNK